MVWRILNTLDLSGSPEAVDVLNSVGELTSLPAERDIVLDRISEFDAYLASASVRIDKEFIDAASKLKVIGSPSTGTDHMDLSVISAANIEVYDIAKEFELINSFSATAELGFGLILSLVRKIPQASNEALKGVWAREEYTGFQLLGKTLGILGLGRLGKISARIGLGFNMRVIAHDIEDVSHDKVEMVDFETLIQDADILTIHVHLNESTRELINTQVFEKMKSSAILINTSRGAVIDENALLVALKNSQISAAGLDVIHGEWLEDILSHPLIRYANKNDNLLIVPHIGGATTESIYGARVFMAKKIAKWIASQK
jgi:D-3-phosphoglycerate dehydrogenase / 2-oxoglutarate reductase